MTRDEQLELTIRIRVLVKFAILGLRSAGHPLAILPLLSAPVSITSGLPCIHRAVEQVERSVSLYPALGPGPRSRAGLAISALRTGAQAVGALPPPEARMFLDRLLESLPGAFGAVSTDPLPTLDDERILLGIA